MRVERDASGAIVLPELAPLAINAVPPETVAELRRALDDLIGEGSEERCPYGAEAHDEWRRYCTDAQIARFAKADGLNLKKAEARARATLRWRAEYGASRRVCVACRDRSPRSHYMQHVGFDRFGRAVVYSCYKWALNVNVPDNIEHMVMCLERVCAAMDSAYGPPEKRQERCVWIMDFWGFGMRNMNPAQGEGARVRRMRAPDTRAGACPRAGLRSCALTRSRTPPSLAGVKACKILAKYYCERLGLGVIVEAPKLFSGLWRVMEPMLDPVTKAKVAFAPGPDRKGQPGKKSARLLQTLQRFFDDEMCDWVMEEMRQNRYAPSLPPSLPSLPPSLHRASDARAARPCRRGKAQGQGRRRQVLAVGGRVGRGHPASVRVHARHRRAVAARHARLLFGVPAAQLEHAWDARAHARRAARRPGAAQLRARPEARGVRRRAVVLPPARGVARRGLLRRAR